MSARIPKNQVTVELRASAVQRTLQAYFKQVLADEREKYELNVASEFQRGRIAMLRDVLSIVKE